MCWLNFVQGLFMHALDTLIILKSWTWDPRLKIAYFRTSVEDFRSWKDHLFIEDRLESRRERSKTLPSWRRERFKLILASTYPPERRWLAAREKRTIKYWYEWYFDLRWPSYCALFYIDAMNIIMKQHGRHAKYINIMNVIIMKQNGSPNIWWILIN